MIVKPSKGSIFLKWTPKEVFALPEVLDRLEQLAGDVVVVRAKNDTRTFHGECP